jgi:hypothetical protein
VVFRPVVRRWMPGVGNRPGWHSTSSFSWGQSADDWQRVCCWGSSCCANGRVWGRCCGRLCSGFCSVLSSTALLSSFFYGAYTCGAFSALQSAGATGAWASFVRLGGAATAAAAAATTQGARLAWGSEADALQAAAMARGMLSIQMMSSNEQLQLQQLRNLPD